MTMKYSRKGRRLFYICILLLGQLAGANAATEPYRLKPGDALRISVWGEEALDREVRVLPDGSITFPLVGLIQVSGFTLGEVTNQLVPALADYVPAPEVSVEVLEASGSRFYVVGKVRAPGAKPLDTPLTVVQALAVAGGLDTFADEDGILLLREAGSDDQTVMTVDYQDIARGILASNYRLQPGDVLLVP